MTPFALHGRPDFELSLMTASRAVRALGMLDSRKKTSTPVIRKVGRLLSKDLHEQSSQTLRDGRNDAS
jgi:hypothetical protein